MPFLSIFGKLSLMETKNLRLSEDLCNFTNEKSLMRLRTRLSHRKYEIRQQLFWILRCPSYNSHKTESDSVATVMLMIEN